MHPAISTAPRFGRVCHRPGALFLDLMQDTSSDLGFTLPPVAQLETLFVRLGISTDTEVVVYSGGHMMWATRAWWLFHYCGHRHARVLNGGLRAWQAGGISATIDAFACLLCGQEEAAVYDGSMAEWVRDESLPMETGG